MMGSRAVGHERLQVEERDPVRRIHVYKIILFHSNITFERYETKTPHAVHVIDRLLALDVWILKSALICFGIWNRFSA